MQNATYHKVPRQASSSVCLGLARGLQLAAAVTVIGLVSCGRLDFQLPDAGSTVDAGTSDAGPTKQPLLVANAGSDRIAAPGALFALDASATTSLNLEAPRYRWTKVSGPTVTLSDPASRSPQLRAPIQATDLTFKLEVFAAEERSSDLVQVYVRENVSDLPPFASAGPDQVLERSASSGATALTLDASQSLDLEGDTLSYRWLSSNATLLGEGVTLTLPGASLQPGPNLIRLELSDGFLKSKDDLIVWSGVQSPAGAPPVLEPLPRISADPGLPVLIWPRVSDPDGDPTRFRWRQLAGVTVTLERDAARARFIAPRRVTRLLFSLDATDSKLAAGPVPVVVEIGPGPGNQAPSADAGPDQRVQAGQAVILDGSGSLDPDGVPLVSHEWLQLSGPLVPLQTPDQARAGFLAPTGPAQLVFALTVYDSQVASAPDLVSITLP